MNVFSIKNRFRKFKVGSFQNWNWQLFNVERGNHCPALPSQGDIALTLRAGILFKFFPLPFILLYPLPLQSPHCCPCPWVLFLFARSLYSLTSPYHTCHPGEQELWLEAKRDNCLEWQKGGNSMIVSVPFLWGNQGCGMAYSSKWLFMINELKG